jgi:two-component system chemotaxis response regulator CheY
MFQPDARFLIIDDSQATRELIRTGLVQMNYSKIDEASNGRMGWDKIQRSVEDKRPYALVLCDINMPEMDGLRLLETVRSDARTQAIPLLIITTEGGKPTVIKAVMAGVSGYMVKPFGLDDVKAKVKEVFGRLNLAR